jgi:thiol:disulfide interchange protein DsbA
MRNKIVQFELMWIVLAFSFGLFYSTIVRADEGSRDLYKGQYERLDFEWETADPSKIEVLVFFWYGCGHCYHLEKPLSDWRQRKPADVEFISIPAVFSDEHPWALLAKAYYVAEALDRLDEFHPKIFEARQDQNQRDIFKNEQGIRDFFVKLGVSEPDLTNAYRSFHVFTQMRYAKEMTNQYNINSVPSLFVNGRYRLTGVGGYEQMLKVVDLFD